MVQEFTIKLHEKLETAAQSQVSVLHRIGQKQRQVLEDERLSSKEPKTFASAPLPRLLQMTV